MLIKVHHQDMYFYLSKRKNEIIKKEKKNALQSSCREQGFNPGATKIALVLINTLQLEISSYFLIF